MAGWHSSTDGRRRVRATRAWPRSNENRNGLILRRDNERYTVAEAKKPSATLRSLISLRDAERIETMIPDRAASRRRRQYRFSARPWGASPCCNPKTGFG